MVNSTRGKRPSAGNHPDNMRKTLPWHDSFQTCPNKCSGSYSASLTENIRDSLLHRMYFRDSGIYSGNLPENMWNRRVRPPVQQHSFNDFSQHQHFQCF